MAFDRPPQDKAMRPQETKKFHRKQKVKCAFCKRKTLIGSNPAKEIICECGNKIIL